MSRRRARRRRGVDGLQDDALIDALGTLGRGYQPDVASIRHTMRSGRHGSTVRQLTRPRRSTAAVLLSAAAVVLLLTGVVGVLRVGPSGLGSGILVGSLSAASQVTPGGSTSGPGPAPARTTAQPVPVVGGAASSSQPQAPGSGGHAWTATTSAAPGPSGSPSTKASSLPPAGLVWVRPARPGSAVTLGGGPQRYWVATGTRPDLGQVWSKWGDGSPLVAVVQPQPSSDRSVPGPFRVSWYGGLPQWSGSAATRWLKVPGPTGLTVVVAASATSCTAVLYAGFSDVNALVSLSRPGASIVPTPLGAAGDIAAATKITVAVPAGVAPTEITLNGVARGHVPSVYLAAVSIICAPTGLDPDPTPWAP